MNLNFKPPEGQVADLEAIKKLLAEVIGKVDLKSVTITQKTAPKAKKNWEFRLYSGRKPRNESPVSFLA